MFQILFVFSPNLLFLFLQMFGRILQLQGQEYGAHDRRCYITMDKIKMVRSQGGNFENAVEELRKTFSSPGMENSPDSTPSSELSKPKLEKSASAPVFKGKPVKANKVFKVLNSMRKRRPIPPP